MRRMFWLLALLCADSGYADTEFWISVGSYQDIEHAEKFREHASLRLQEAFTVSPAETPSGYFYRVMAGPFLQRESAEYTLQKVHEAGFADAWMLTTEGPVSLYRTTNFDELDIDLPPIGELPVIPQLPAIKKIKPRLEPVREAPEDYQLHKLHRDALLQLESEPYLLASTDPNLANAFAGCGGGVPNNVHVAHRELQVDLRVGKPFVLERFEHDLIEIEIDGKLDEPQWGMVASFDNLKVVEPDTLVNGRYATDIRMFYTERGLYISFDMEQPRDTIVKRFSTRDAGRLNRDSVSFTLDTSGEGRYGYWMNLALGDNQVDGTILPERRYSRDWDGAWYGATSLTERGWIAEYFVPWSQTAMPKQSGSRRMGLYVTRKVAYLDERWGWPALPRSQTKFMSSFQPLDLHGVDPKQQWSLFPFSAATFDNVAGEEKYKTGFDFFWRPSTNFQVTATVNPDFGNVEADDVIVNLSANETFFPEKRLFFQEGREIFNTSPSRRFNSLSVVNTRRIGGRPASPATRAGETVASEDLRQLSELAGAVKVTGQQGGFRYGFLAAREKELKFDALSLNGDNLNLHQDGRDFGVMRLLYEDNDGGAYRGFGWISTLVTNPAGDAVVHGADFHYLSAAGGWKFDGQLLRSDLEQAGEGYGGLLNVQYSPRSGLRYTLSTSYFDDSLDINDLGFQRRNDASDISLRAEWIKSGLDWVRDFRISPSVRYERNGQGRITQAGFGLSQSYTLHNLSKVDVNAFYSPEHFDDRSSFGNGTYRVENRSSMSLNYRSNSSRKLSFSVGGGLHGEATGDYGYQAAAGITWRPFDRVNFELQTKYRNRNGWLLHQEENNFTSFSATQWEPNFKFDFFITAKQQFRIALQWVGITAEEDKFYTISPRPDDLIEGAKPLGETDDFSISQLNFQMRYRWQIAPLSDLFVVYTRGASKRGTITDFDDLFQDAWDNPLDEQLVIKLRYRVGT